MKKSLKTTAAFLLAATLASTCVFAQTKEKSDTKKEDVKIERAERRNFRKPGKNGFGCFGMQMQHNESVLVGKVKKVDTKAQKIFLINSDGKDVEVNLSPFTRMFIELTDNNYKRLPPVKPEVDAEGKKVRPKPLELGDIHSGDWVMVTPFKTDTKTVNAASIFAKARKVDTSAAINAK